MPKPNAQYVNCLHCTRGPKGDKSCAAGFRARTLKGSGCFLGAWKPGKEPKVLGGIKVERVEAPTYPDAWSIARDAGYKEWIWVKDSVPQESHG